MKRIDSIHIPKRRKDSYWRDVRTDSQVMRDEAGDEMVRAERERKDKAGALA